MKTGILVVAEEVLSIVSDDWDHDVVALHIRLNMIYVGLKVKKRTPKKWTKLYKKTMINMKRTTHKYFELRGSAQIMARKLRFLSLERIPRGIGENKESRNWDTIGVYWPPQTASARASLSLWDYAGRK